MEYKSVNVRTIEYIKEWQRKMRQEGVDIDPMWLNYPETLINKRHYESIMKTHKELVELKINNLEIKIYCNINTDTQYTPEGLEITIKRLVDNAIKSL